MLCSCEKKTDKRDGPRSTTTATSETEDNFDYEVNSIDSDITIDLFMDYWVEHVDITDPRVEEVDEYDYLNDFHFNYKADYQSYLVQYMNNFSGCQQEEIEEEVFAPAEYEYHIMSRVYVNGVGVGVELYDSKDQAEETFREFLDSALSYEDELMICNAANEGYYCSFLWRYSIVYLVDNQIVWFYHFNDSTEEQYIMFTEFCDEFNLPVPQELTDAIL